jgi:two-component system, response regulator YesN
MQILIVDDESIVVKDLKASISWDNLGISSVFTAFSISKAKEIFNNNKIDLMLCDIEMPQGSGLDLLLWVRENSPHTETIFLTCHADFRYVKEAIRLGSQDYILKPVSYTELELVLSKAIAKIKKDNELIENSRYGKYWHKYQPKVVENFWFEILNRTIPSNKKDIKNAADDRNIPYTEDMKFLPILFNIRRWHTAWTLQDQKLMEYAFKNIASETVVKEGSNGQIIEMGNGKFIIVLSNWNRTNTSTNSLKIDCEICIAACQEHLKCDITSYIGEEIFASELTVIVDKLYELEKNNVVYENRVFLINQSQEISNILNFYDMNLWSVMLGKGIKDSLTSEVMNYLKNLSCTSGINAHILKQFHYNFMQMIYSTLKLKGIQAHQLLSDNESVKLQDKAVSSYIDLTIWIKHVIRIVIDYIKEEESSQSVVDKVREFIQINIEQELTREEIALKFYLNPDYLDRIFKRETELSVTRYMVQEKLKIAQDLLTKTEMPIKNIATSLGYKNFSHFSTAFKKFTNMNSFEFRKKRNN